MTHLSFPLIRVGDWPDSRDDGGSRRRRAAVEPKVKVQHNFTDPESSIMKGPDGVVQAYNAQAAVEPTL